MFQVLRQRVLLDVFLNVPARQVRLQVLLHHKVQGCLQPAEIRWVITNSPSPVGALYPSPGWGKQQESLRYPLCQAGGGRGLRGEHSCPATATTSPESPVNPQHIQLVDAVLQVTQPIL